jgi:hypothetical protein
MEDVSIVVHSDVQVFTRRLKHKIATRAIALDADTGESFLESRYVDFIIAKAL